MAKKSAWEDERVELKLTLEQARILIHILNESQQLVDATMGRSSKASEVIMCINSKLAEAWNNAD